MLFVTFHGGSDDCAASELPPSPNLAAQHTKPHNNVNAYDETDPGAGAIKDILAAPAGKQLDELRGLLFANGYLYVAVGSKHQNAILCYQPSATPSKGSYKFMSVLADQTCASISHPFDLTLNGTGQCWASSQDTNVVTELTLSSNGQSATWTSGASASYLAQFGSTFLPGTFVASSKPVPGGNTPDVPASKGGLLYALASDTTAVDDGKHSEKIQNSVRGVAFCNNLLCVVDEVANAVKVYDPGTGRYLCSSNVSMQAPVHLLVSGTTLYVSAGQQVFSGTPQVCGIDPMPMPPNPFYCLNLTPLALDPPLADKASGMCFDASGNLYIALRTAREIWCYDANLQSSSKPLFKDFDDDLEFVVWQPS
jgi:hypothetical protein